MSLSETILASNDSKRLSVELPDWGTTGYVKTHDGLWRGQLSQDWIDWRDANAGGEVGGKFYRAFIVVRCLLDKSGNRIFRDEQTKALAAKSGKMISLVIEAVDRLNAVTDDEIGRLVKNCDAPTAS